MSRSVRGPDYRNPTYLHQCHECATLTANPIIAGAWLCDAHQPAPALLFCDEVHSEFRAGRA